MGNASALGYGFDEAQLHSNLAVTLIGAGLNGVLFGILCGQTGYYLRHSFRRDRAFIRSMVSLLFLLNVLHIVFNAHTAYEFLVSGHAANYGEAMMTSPSALPWSSYSQVFLNSVAVFIIQMFYAHRIWKIGKCRIHAAVLGVLICITFGNGLVLFAFTVLSMDTWELLAKVLQVEIAISVTFAVTDLFLTTSLLVLLLKHAKDSAAGPNPLVKRLITYTMSTGVLTCVCALTGLITIIVLPDAVISLMLWYLGTSLYSTSLMASLNAREALRTKYVQDTQFHTGASTTMPRFTTIYADGADSPAAGSMTFTRTDPDDAELVQRHVDTLVDVVEESKRDTLKTIDTDTDGTHS